MKLAKMIISVACLLGFAAPLQAQTCNAILPETTPTSEFTDNLDGTVTHSRTGLMWKRCAEGQTWSGASCTGSASIANWANALKSAVSATTGGYSDWRLPNLKELRSIVDEKCYHPSINALIFPNTPASFFWSASAYANDSAVAWGVDFYYGNANYGNGTGYGIKGNSYQVRLVRAGQSFGAFDSYHPVRKVNLTPILMLLLD